MSAMKMRQRLSDFEEEFLREVEQDQRRRAHLQRTVRVRSRKRHLERRKQQGARRFYTVMFTLIATAVIVTVAMFETLYRLLV